MLSYKWRLENYPFAADDRVACNVFFVWEMLRSLLAGIPLYVIPENVIYDPPLLMKFIQRHKITRILFTPSLFGMLFYPILSFHCLFVYFSCDYKRLHL